MATNAPQRDFERIRRHVTDLSDTIARVDDDHARSALEGLRTALLELTETLGRL